MNFPSCDLSSGCGGLSQRSDRLEPEPVLGLKSEYDFVFRIHLSFQPILFDYKEAKRIIVMHNDAWLPGNSLISWPVIVGAEGISHVILVSCITRHLTLLLPTLSLLILATILVFTIYILSPGARAESLWAWENFPGTRLLSLLDIEILFMGRKYILITANIQHLCSLQERWKDTHFKNLYCFQIDPCLEVSSCPNGWINKSKYY